VREEPAEVVPGLYAGPGCVDLEEWGVDVSLIVTLEEGIVDKDLLEQLRG